jgi:hypothetical protein
LARILRKIILISRERILIIKKILCKNMKKKDFINKEIGNHYLVSNKSLLSNFSQHYFNTILHHEGSTSKNWKTHIRKDCQNTPIENLENIIDFTADAAQTGTLHPTCPKILNILNQFMRNPMKPFRSNSPILALACESHSWSITRISTNS